MYVDHLRKEFYEKLYDERILVMSAMDVDAICSTKILLHLFRMDNISYTVELVEGINELKTKFLESKNQVKIAILVNCGGTIDLLDLLGNPAGTIFYILDHHRPTHVLNIYNESKQIRILCPAMEDENVPKFDDIFRAPESEDEDSEDEQEDESEATGTDGQDTEETDGDELGAAGPKPKQKRRNEDAILEKRSNRRAWEEKRHDLLHKYTVYTTYGAPVSTIALELAYMLGRDENDIIWWSIVGLTHFMVMNHIQRSAYTILVTELQNHIARVNHSNVIPLDCLKIAFEVVPNLYLYRRWNVYDSMKFTPEFACKFKSWNANGLRKFHQYLAEIGLPLAQARQCFSAMDMDLRHGLKEVMARRAVKYKLEDINIGSFFGTCGYRYKYSAMDNHMAALAILEFPNDMSNSDRFLRASQCLSKENFDILDAGVEDAKIYVTAIHKQVRQIMELKQIVCTQSVMYVVMQEGGPDSRFFTRPNTLLLFSDYLLKAFSCHRTGYRMKDRPLLVISPPQDGQCLALGIPPLLADHSANLFGKVYERLQGSIPGSIELDCFDSHICRVKSEDKAMFIEAMLHLFAD